MHNLQGIEKMDIAQKRKDVESLCSHLFSQMQHLACNGKDPLVFDRFTLVRALEEIFYPELVCVSGYNIFIPIYDEGVGSSDLMLHPHHWLASKANDKYIIDVLPCDGEFGVSVPQIVIQNKQYKRFVPAGSMYPVTWGKPEKDLFSKKVSFLVDIFEYCLR